MDYFHTQLDHAQLGAISNLGLAYMGDGVYELMVRAYLCRQGKATNKGLHKAAVKYVAAPGQAAAVKAVAPLLTEEEQDVLRRGRNASPHSIPAHASREEYAAATSLETLFGWLYLNGNVERLNQLFGAIMEETQWP